MPNSFIRLFCFALFCIGFGNPVSSAEMIYKCKTAQGKLFYQNKPCTEDVETVTSWESKPKPQAEPSSDENTEDDPILDDGETLVLKQDPSGHYFLNAQVNTTRVGFLVDTGASLVVLPTQLAQQAGLRCRGRMSAETANGRAAGCVTKIDRLKFGAFVVKNVDVAIVQNLSTPLFGMNILNQFKVIQNAGEMRISKQ